MLPWQGQGTLAARPVTGALAHGRDTIRAHRHEAEAEHLTGDGLGTSGQAVRFPDPAEVTPPKFSARLICGRQHPRALEGERGATSRIWRRSEANCAAMARCAGLAKRLEDGPDRGAAPMPANNVACRPGGCHLGRTSAESLPPSSGLTKLAPPGHTTRPVRQRCVSLRPQASSRNWDTQPHVGTISAPV